jgi:hypothetical protein
MSCCCSPFGGGGGGGAVGGLSNVFYVDGGTTVVGGDGTDEQPFATVTAAVAAVPDGSTLMVCAFDYSAEPAINLTKWLNFWGQGDGQDVVLPPLTWDAGVVLNFKDCTVALSGILDAEIGCWDSFVTSGGEDCEAVFEVSGGTFSGNHQGVTAENCDCSSGLASTFAASVELAHCAVGDVGTSAGQISFLDCEFPAAVAFTANSISMDRVSEYRAALAGCSPSVLPTPLETSNPIYGSGGTGDVVLNAGSVLLAPGTEYNNLTLTGTGAVRCEATILKVKNLLDLTTCGTLAVRDYSGGAGANGVGAAGGAAWGGTGGHTQGTTGTRNAEVGANGGKGAGAQPAAAGLLNTTFGGRGGAGGAGGAGDGGAGGASVAAAAVTNERVPVDFQPVYAAQNTTNANTIIPVFAAQPGQAGSAGGGSTAGAGSNGGGGGGAGRGGGVVAIYARGIALGPATPATAISAAGQNGGNGGNSEGGNGGGAGGGAGGGGGLVVVAYDWIIGNPPAADEILASGGAGGTGGNGTGTGIGGNGGGGGNGGQIVLWNLLTNTRKVVNGANGTAGSAAVGAAGGAGGAAGACVTDLP